MKTIKTQTTTKPTSPSSRPEEVNTSCRRHARNITIPTKLEFRNSSYYPTTKTRKLFRIRDLPQSLPQSFPHPIRNPLVSGGHSLFTNDSDSCVRKVAIARPRARPFSLARRIVRRCKIGVTPFFTIFFIILMSVSFSFLVTSYFQLNSMKANTNAALDSFQSAMNVDTLYYTYTDPMTNKIVKAVLHGTQNTYSPQTIHYMPTTTSSLPKHNSFYPDPTLKCTVGEEPPAAPLYDPYKDENCFPMAEWQVQSKPTCNSIHELNLLSSNRYIEETETIMLGKGWFRIALQVNTGTNKDEDAKDTYVLKMLRYDREFLEEYHELHRRDAMAMERLSGSIHVLDIYSYCAQSAMNEYAIDSIEQFSKKMRDDFTKNLYKLYLAKSVASGVADMHEIDYSVDNATLVHYDLNPRNVAIVKGGHAKINDFNVAEFLQWNRVENKPCKFKGRFKEPWWRAPEEIVLVNQTVDGNFDGRPLLDEKVDVYSLGNIIFRLLTGRAPRGKSIKQRIDIVKREVANGLPPSLPVIYNESRDPAVISMRDAMKECYVKNPAKRISARTIANSLEKDYKLLSEKLSQKLAANLKLRNINNGNSKKKDYVKRKILG